MERRTQPTRPRTLKGGRIVFNQSFSTMDCMIRNLTDTGARLELDAAHNVPDRFILRFDSELSDRNCEVRWRKGNAIGVEFVG